MHLAKGEYCHVYQVRVSWFFCVGRDPLGRYIYNSFFLNLVYSIIYVLVIVRWILVCECSCTVPYAKNAWFWRLRYMNSDDGTGEIGDAVCAQSPSSQGRWMCAASLRTIALARTQSQGTWGIRHKRSVISWPINFAHVTRIHTN